MRPGADRVVVSSGSGQTLRAVPVDDPPTLSVALMLVSMIPALTTLMTVDVHAVGTHQWAEVHLPASNRQAAAFRVALHIAWQRCSGAPQYFNAWLSRYQGGPAHAPDLLDCMTAFLGSESIGTRTKPAADVHLEGFVAEHIWHLLTIENALAFGTPVRVDGPDWW